MIRVRKIAHASYEMPDLDKQTEYYTDILGLTLTAKDKDAVYRRRVAGCPLGDLGPFLPDGPSNSRRRSTARPGRGSAPAI